MQSIRAFIAPACQRDTVSSVQSGIFTPEDGNYTYRDGFQTHPYNKVKAA